MHIVQKPPVLFCWNCNVSICTVYVAVFRPPCYHIYMYNVLLVDDEPMIRQGMAHLIPWEKYGFSLIASAANCAEAVSLCKKMTVHLLLTDIRMPGSDGLELIKIISEYYPNIVFVVLSGYSEFEYARQALNLGVYQYLLKPINPNELITTLKGVKALLDANHHNETSFQKLLQHYNSLTNKRIMHEMMDYISDNLSEGVTLEFLSAQFNLSAVYISKLFKQEIGVNFIDWLAILRVEKAKELLEKTNLKAYEVASLVGYTDVRYFGQSFKKIVGLTPSEYRKQIDSAL